MLTSRCSNAAALPAMVRLSHVPLPLGIARASGQRHQRCTDWSPAPATLPPSHSAATNCCRCCCCCCHLLPAPLPPACGPALCPPAAACPRPACTQQLAEGAARQAGTEASGGSLQTVAAALRLWLRTCAALRTTTCCSYNHHVVKAAAMPWRQSIHSSATAGSSRASPGT
jgi:hypothetical protein